MKARCLFATAVLASVATACGGRTVVVTPAGPLSPAVRAQLWVEPRTGERNLFSGIGRSRSAPDPDGIYTLVSKDETGFSVGYDVVGSDGTEWSVKIGPEAQTEVVVSRVLWGLGYHQPPVYYLPSWRLAAGVGGSAGRWDRVSGGSAPRSATISEARFRPKVPQLERLNETWSWADNPFSGTPELKALLAILLMLNSTDLKDSNNSIYELAAPSQVEGRWYVVRDLGAALGETGALFPRRNWLEGFERESFITRMDGATIEFGYKGRHQDLLAMIAPGDVKRAAAMMARLTDAQWRDAFRAGNYAASHADRYIRRIKEKIADGLALRIDRRETDGED